MLPMEALSSSTDGAKQLALSAGSGLILILNFFRWSSSPSDSLEEKKCSLGGLGPGGSPLRTAIVSMMKVIGDRSRVKLPLDADLVFSTLMVKVRIGGGEADPRSVPRINFTPESVYISKSLSNSIYYSIQPGDCTISSQNSRFNKYQTNHYIVIPGSVLLAVIELK